MSKKWFLVGGAAVLIVAAGLYGGLVVYLEARLRAALSAAAHVLPAGIPRRLDVTIANVPLVRPSLTLAKDWQRAERDRETLRPEAAIPVAAALKLTDITIHTKTLSEKIRSARINGLRLYPWVLLHPAIPSLTEGLAMLEHRPRP